ncbi:MAG: phosphate acyltransferase, partial [Gallionella sp.]|nr:phosphate acyltransferase [Gallionella sp.]
MDITLAIDAMGGDHGTAVTVRAAVDYLKHSPGDTILLVGISDAIEAELRALGAQVSSHLRIRSASEVVGMDESPQSVMRGKKDSSMRVSIDLVKSGEANASP